MDPRTLGKVDFQETSGVLVKITIGLKKTKWKSGTLKEERKIIKDKRIALKMLVLVAIRKDVGRGITNV